MISRVEKREYRILTVYILIRTLNSSGELVPDPECKNPPEAPDSNCTNSELERDPAECMNSSSLEDPPRESDDTVGVAVGAAVAIVIIVTIAIMVLVMVIRKCKLQKMMKDPISPHRYNK